MRLIQVDFAVVDDRSPIGWVFGTFMYDGTLGDIADVRRIFRAVLIVDLLTLLI